MTKQVSYPGPGHILVIGDPRCNKTAGILIPNILMLDQRPLIIVNDCRGEIDEIIYPHRSTLGPYIRINPFNLREAGSDGFNPMIDLDPLKPSFYSASLAYGEGAIQRRPNDAQPIFNLGAQTLYSIMTMLAKLTFGQSASPMHVQTMIAMAQVAKDNSASAIIQKAIDGDYSSVLCPDPEHNKNGPCLDPSHNAPCPYPQFDIRNGGKPFEPLQLLARQFMAKATTESRFFQDRVSTAQTETGKLNDPQLIADMQKVPTFNGKPFEFSDMRKWIDPKKKKGVYTVIINMPSEYFITHSVYMRMLLTNAINSLMRAQPGPEAPLVPLIIVEEMGQLGQVTAVETSINLAAGNGLQYMMVFQQLSQMREAYGEHGVGKILGACDVKLCFCSGDEYTQSYMSRQGGSKTLFVKSFHDDSGLVTKTGSSANHHQQTVQLIKPDDIRDLQKGELFAFIKHSQPVKLNAHGYFNPKEWPNLKGKYGKNTILPMNQRSAA